MRLAFRSADVFERVSDPVAEDLSAVARAGDTLFLSCDETAGVERLRPDGKGGWAGHDHVSLGDMFDLPAGPSGEMDIEGLAAADGWLWVVGSHALKRNRPDGPDGLADLARIERDPNRSFLGRLPLAPAPDGGLIPVSRHGDRRAACAKLTKTHGKLHRWLADDPHIGPFLDVPSKDNGLDIEGIAARGDRIWLGLRGPVLRGHAVVLELEIRQTGKHRLKARKIDGKRRYRKHLLPGFGLGVRDLALAGDDLMVLLGPTMSSDGPAHILRWRGAVAATGSGVIPESAVEVVADLPHRGPVDHPEGIEPWPEGGTDTWLVVHDAPAEERLDRQGLAILADLVRLR